MDRFRAYQTTQPGVVRVEAELGDFAFPAHSHDHLCIGLVRDGAHDCRYGLRRYTVQRGDLMLVNPGEVHDGRPAGSRGRRYSMLEVELGTFRELAGDLELPRPVTDDPIARVALLAWIAALDTPDVDASESAAVLFGHLAAEPISRGTARGIAVRVARRLRDDPFAVVAELAVEAGVSRYALIRAFKQTFGLTPEDYRRQRRIERARELLGGGDLASIAAAAGFADQSHMTREFRRFLGLSPAGYARAFKTERRGRSTTRA